MPRDDEVADYRIAHIQSRFEIDTGKYGMQEGYLQVATKK